MRGLLATLATLVAFAGVALVWVGARPTAPNPTRPTSRRAPPAPLRALLGSNLPAAARRRHQLLLSTAALAGAVVWLLTGWVLAIALVPALTLGLPTLLRAPAGGADIEVLAGLESWTRGLSGVLTTGAGIEYAIETSLASTSGPVRPHVQALVARLRANWATPAALQVFADDLNDSTGDLVVGALILGAKRPGGAGLTAVLEDLATTVAEEISLRRSIEADRAKPRSTARLVTLMSVPFIGWSVLTSPAYQSGVGQLVVLVMLGAYVAALLWMRQMAVAARTPRFLPASPRSAL